MPLIVSVIVLVVLLVWLLLLTVYVIRLSTHYNRLVADSSKRTLQSILEDLLKDVDVTKKDIATISNKYDTMLKESKIHIQRVGLLRFNPFKDTGGDQSFILALLDGNNTGVVLSGLYSRAGTRWYAKKIVEGKPIEHELSDEEKQAIKQASQI